MTTQAVLAVLTRLCLVQTDATKVRVSPVSPRVPTLHTLELHCESQCDAHLKQSLRLSWSKDGEAFEMNGTEDGRWVNAYDKKQVKRVHTELKYWPPSM